jgi:hypothetical protein
MLRKNLKRQGSGIAGLNKFALPNFDQVLNKIEAQA